MGKILFSTKKLFATKIRSGKKGWKFLHFAGFPEKNLK